MTGHDEVEINAEGSPNSAGERGALVEVRFQKNPYQDQKYLEAEPKALGITQIMLSLFFLSGKWIIWRVDSHVKMGHIISSSLSSVSIIAGSIALAAQNLHLPTLKACLGMQIVTCTFSVICFVLSLESISKNFIFNICYNYNKTETAEVKTCEELLAVYNHLCSLEMLVQATQIAISATLASFCCKVIQCCSPRGNVPIIVVNAPPALQ